MASYYNSYFVKHLDQRKPYENLTSVKKINYFNKIVLLREKMGYGSADARVRNINSSI